MFDKKSFSHSSLAIASSHRRSGFTLTEVAIVLGIAGLVLGAIWVAGAIVSQNNKVRLAIQETALILQNYRSQYSTHGIDFVTDTSGVSKACDGVKNNYFPAEMMQPGVACVTGLGSTLPINPWGSPADVVVQSLAQVIAIVMYGMPRDACNSYAVQQSGVPDLLFMQVNAVNVAAPYKATDIAAQCAAGTSNSVAVEFSAR